MLPVGGEESHSPNDEIQSGGPRAARGQGPAARALGPWGGTGGWGSLNHPSKLNITVDQ